ncbi:cytoplasmic fmr1-interacting protein-related [Anaeramoeba flamelloides]|uniref:Cytoplasmic fmr1-interacting protein-related n=1 Tax=Anaeramoeba flamelloides TaxID=1746091 RepID=A0AAV7YYI9_9EUKA|nr:cytoplasmic fmr1-interacting protein-related [Anaeramoeba flamelloides]
MSEDKTKKKTKKKDKGKKGKGKGKGKGKKKDKGKNKEKKNTLKKKGNKNKNKNKTKKSKKKETSVDHVLTLQNYAFENDTPTIEALSPLVIYDTNDDIQFKDYGAYEDFSIENEVVLLNKLSDSCKEGNKLVSLLYSHRPMALSISNSKNDVKDKRFDEKEKVEELHRITHEILKPLSDQAKRLMNFRDETTELFCEIVKTYLDQKKNGAFTSNIKQELVTCLDVYILVDLLIANKSSFSNDFSHFKREFSILFQGNLESALAIEEMHKISLFIANNYSLIIHLKTELAKIPNYEEILEELINYTVEIYENNQYYCNSEKSRYLRTMVTCLILLDQKNEKKNVFKSKNIPLAKIGKFIKWTPYILYCGDMAMRLEEFLAQCPHYSKDVFSSIDEKKIASGYLLTTHLDQQREEHNSFVSDFSHMLNVVRVQRAQKEEISTEQHDEIIALIRRGFRLISLWSTKVIEQLAWKYTHPTQDPNLPKEVTGYEKVVKYNYTDEEKEALVEFISMIKGVSALMKKSEVNLYPIIRSFIHDQIQEFALTTLRPMIKKAAKKKKKKILGKLVWLRTILADWKNGKEQEDLALNGKNYKDKLEYDNKNVGITRTQHVLIISLLENMFSEKAAGMKGGFMKGKDFTSGEVKEFQEFLNKLWVYPYLMNYSETVRKSSDLGIVWYREFHLGLNEVLQFPIEMSLPWIITRYALSMKTSYLAEMMLYPLSLYSDAAEHALKVLKQKFLYDEIEAEVDLTFDQLVFVLTEEIYSYYKNVASIKQLDNVYKHEIKKLKPKLNFVPPKSRYHILLRQRHFHLLGRTVNLTELISQRMNNILRQNIDWAIKKFESSDITGIMDLEYDLTNIQIVHRLLSEYLTLDSFDSMFQEVNESASLKSLQSRVVLHCIFQFIEDLATNFVYNSVTQRFLRSPLTFVGEVPRSHLGNIPEIFTFGSTKLNDLFEEILERYHGFFGIPHVLAILKWIGEDNLPLIAQECLTNVELKIQNVLAPYVEELLAGMITKTNLLSMDNYGIDGCFGGFQVPLDNLRKYPPLETKVYQNLRELGNTIVLMYLFEQAMPQLKVRTFLNSAPFLCIIPKKALRKKAKKKIRLLRKKKKLVKKKKDKKKKEKKTKKSRRKKKQQSSDESSGEEEPEEIKEEEIEKWMKKFENKFKKNTLSGVIERLLENGSKHNISKSENLSKSLVFSCKKAEDMYKPNEKPISIFLATLLHVNKMLDPVREKWLGDRKKGLPNIERSNEFYRLWSALQFMFCLKLTKEDINKEDEDEEWEYEYRMLSNQETYGDGFAWAGAAIIHFLGQRNVFNALDFSYHILNANEALEEKTEKPEIKSFLKQAKWLQDLNEMLFSILRSYCPIPEPEIVEFEPPEEEELSKIPQSTVLI